MIHSVLLGYFGPWEIIIVVLILLLLFGGRKLPELMKGMGQGLKEFKKATQSDDEEKSNEKKGQDDKKDDKQLSDN